MSDFTAAGTRPLFTAAAFTGLQATGDHLFFAADAGAGQEPGFFFAAVPQGKRLSGYHREQKGDLSP